VQVSVTFRHVDPTDPLREYATEKVSRVASKYLRNALDAHVILSVTKYRHQAEINIHASHFDISAQESTGDLYSAIDLAVDKVEAQLRRHKDRINDRKGRQSASAEIPGEASSGDEPEPTSAATVVESHEIPAKPLSVEDAILQLELKHADFLVFRDSTTEQVSVLYRRRDGNYGLITPSS
jgi:putative sigma-54 modulation protein